MSHRPLSRYGVVSDEIHADPAVAFAVAEELGMGSVDLNSLWGKPVTDLGDAEVEAVVALAQRHHLAVFMVAGLPFKSLVVEGLAPDQLLAAPAFREHMLVLERSLRIARQLGAACVRVHGFAWPPPPGGGAWPRRPGGGEIPPEVLATIAAGLRAACAAAAKSGVFLGLENVRAAYANTGRNLRVIVEAVADQRLRVVWDPANAYVSGEDLPYPEGHAHIRAHIAHVHVKDARLVDQGRGTTAWECVGRGAVDFPAGRRRDR